ncbi:MAG: MATE family efflux transporter [Bacteroidota bacterium]
MESAKQEDLRVNTGYRDILKLAMPITLALLVPQINFITNNVFLSGLGERELASAGLTGVYYLIFAVVGSGLSNGMQMLFARRSGENRPEEIGKLFYNGSWVAVLFCIAGIGLTWTIGPSVLRWSIHDDAIAEQVIGFLKIRIWGLPFLYLYGLRNALLVGTGKSKFLVWGTLSEALTNIFFDYTLIYGKAGFPAIGFNGAAYASIIAEATGLLVVFSVIRLNRIHLQFSLNKNRVIDKSVIRTIVVQSSPLIMQYGISIVTWEYYYILIEHYGARALAVSNTMRNIFGLVGIFSWAFASTTNTMVSNLIGQGRSDEVLTLVKRVALVSIAFCLPVIIVLNLFPGWFLGFYSLGGDFIDYAIPVVRVVSIALVLMSFSSVWLNSVTGTGKTVVNLSIEIVTIIVYIIYVYLVLEKMQLGIVWGWGSEVVYWVCMFSMAWWYMQSGRWRNGGQAPGRGGV